MLSKAHLTSHSRMSGSRWVITPSWLSGSWRSFLYSSSVYSCHLFFNIFCFCYIHTIYVCYQSHLCMKCSLGISNFLDEISRLSHSIVFPYFFALITEEGFLISPCFSLGLEWKLTFSSPVATAEFSKFVSILRVTLSQHLLSGFEIAQLEFHHLH